MPLHSVGVRSSILRLIGKSLLANGVFDGSSKRVKLRAHSHHSASDRDLKVPHPQPLTPHSNTHFSPSNPTQTKSGGYFSFVWRIHHSTADHSRQQSRMHRPDWSLDHLDPPRFSRIVPRRARYSVVLLEPPHDLPAS